MTEQEIQSGGPVWDLVAEFLERRERGDAVDAETFIRSHRDVADRLREALAGFQWMDATARPGHAAMNEVLPRTFGNYELLRVIGRGGMGCVYEAVHRPLKRHVAVKVLPPHLTNVREFRLRFLREARVVASLHHTHIAPVFEVGQIGNTLYLAMPFIDGPNLRELTVPLPEDTLIITRAMRARLPAPLTLAYFRWVADLGVQSADALAHAHERGVIHRDIKPSNLLLDEHGDIWIVDFGLAKAETHPTVTQPGELIGTLRYASPEQVRGDRFDVRTDVYSLGVTLYEILTRRPAFPPGPGNQVIATEPIRPRQVNSNIPRDLETIVLRAMARRPEDRYPSAAALADDLRRFLRDEPIRARPIGLVGRLVRWSRRNPAVTGVAAAAAFLLTALTVLHSLRLAEHEKNLKKVEGISSVLFIAMLKMSAAQSIDSGQPDRTRIALENIREAAKIQVDEELWELALRALDQVDVAGQINLKAATEPITTLAETEDGKVIAASGPDGKLTFWNTESGDQWTSTGFGEPLTGITCSPDGTRLAAVSNRHVWLGRINIAAKTLDDVRAIHFEPAAVTFAPGGGQIALWGTTLGVWDIAQVQLLAAQPPGRVRAGANVDRPYQAVAWSLDGKILAAVPFGEATVEFWSMPEANPLTPIGVLDIDEGDRNNGPPITAIAFSPDSGSQARIACACADGAIRIYNRETANLDHTLRGHEGPLRWIRYVAPAGSTAGQNSVRTASLIVSADAHDVRIWDATRGQQLAVLVRNLDELRSAAVDSRGQILTVVDNSGVPQCWQLSDVRRHQVIGPEPRRITSVVTTAKSNQIAWGGERGHVTISDLEQRRLPTEFDSGLENVRLAFSPGGTNLAIGGDGNPPIQIRSVTDGQVKELGAGHAAVVAIAFVGSGDRLATAHADGKLVIWSIETGEPFAQVSSKSIATLAASSNGKWLAGGSTKGELYLWNATNMSPKYVPAAPQSQIPSHESQILSLAFSQDDQSLVSASRDGRICRWQVPSMKLEYSFPGAGGPVLGLAFCLDGSTLATCGGDGRVLLWTADRHTRIGAMSGRFVGRFDVLASSPDGRKLIAAGGPRGNSAAGRGAIEIWNLADFHRAILDAGLPDWRTADARTK